MTRDAMPDLCSWRRTRRPTRPSSRQRTPRTPSPPSMTIHRWRSASAASSRAATCASTRPCWDRLPALEIITTFGVGYDGLPLAAAAARGIPVTNTPDVLNTAVAELCVGMLLGLLRRLPASDRFVRDGNWPQGAMPLGVSLSGKRVGIVGLGRIGKDIAAASNRSASALPTTAATTSSSPIASNPTWCGWHRLRRADRGRAGWPGHAQADRRARDGCARFPAATWSISRAVRWSMKRRCWTRWSKKRWARPRGCLRTRTACRSAFCQPGERLAGAAHRQRDDRNAPGHDGPGAGESALSLRRGGVADAGRFVVSSAIGQPSPRRRSGAKVSRSADLINYCWPSSSAPTAAS